MHTPTRWLVLILSALVVSTATSAAAQPIPTSGMDPDNLLGDAPADDTAVYIVQLEGDPVAVFEGNGRMPATNPRVTGAGKLDLEDPAVEAYTAHLARAQDTFTAKVSRLAGREVDVLYNYRYVLNGVGVRLSANEADRVAALPEVVRVELSRMDYILTDAGPEWIGADHVWDGSAVPGGEGNMGEGIIVGVIDTGINQDHASFAAVGGDGYVHENPLPGYVGYCDPENPHFDPELYICNDKLIGMWGFPETGNNPEDDHGHGSHTASTAAGNFITSTLVAPTEIFTTPLQGVAPHANIIAYDACTASGGCPSGATVAAIDQAAADGVDVINYSISQSRLNPWSDDNVVLTAFRNARNTGVAASVSAGNSGPGAFTAAAIGPYMTSVGASTHNRRALTALKDMTGGDSSIEDIVGRSLSGMYGPAPIVYAGSGEYLKADGQPDNGQCLTPFPDGTFDGEIVVCDRGSIARVAKGANVLAGGAGGLVLANTPAQGDSLVADAHFLPAVHITDDDGEALKNWLATGTGHMATIGGTEFVRDAEYGDIMAGFSSRGPTQMGVCCVRPYGEFTGGTWLDVLKPDVTAPGVDVWAAVATDPDDPAPFDEVGFMSGTSMSSPHTAGSKALVRGVHPDWTPAEVQSALMTTSMYEGVRKENEVTPADHFDMGAGRIQVDQAVNAGFVLDMTEEEFAAENPQEGGDPTTLNLASMTDFSCTVGCSWTRTLKSTRDEDVEWTASAVADTPVLDLSVEPISFTLPADGMTQITVTAETTDFAAGDYGFGRIMLEASDDSAPAHLPVTVHVPEMQFPDAFEATLPPITTLEAGHAEDSYTLKDWVAPDVESLVISPTGYTTATITTTLLAQDPTPGNPFNGDGGVAVAWVDVPEGSPRLVAEIMDAESSTVNVWIGIDVNGDGQPAQNETVYACCGGGWYVLADLRGPPAASFWILVHNNVSSDPSDPDVEDAITLAFAAMDAGADTMTAEGPESTVAGETFDIELGWDLGEGWSPGQLAYGLLTLSDGDSGEELTTAAIDLYGVEPPPAIYLPVAHNGEERICAESFPDDCKTMEGPWDPSGHVIDRVDPSAGTAIADTQTMVTLFKGLKPSGTGADAEPGVDCSMKASPIVSSNWEMQPPANVFYGVPNPEAVGLGVIVPWSAITTPPSPNNNPLATVMGSGAYGWLDGANACFYVKAERGGEVHYSPLVGVADVADDPLDVDDLHHCWPTDRWFGLVKNAAGAPDWTAYDDTSPTYDGATLGLCGG